MWRNTRNKKNYKAGRATRICSLLLAMLLMLSVLTPATSLPVYADEYTESVEEVVEEAVEEEFEVEEEEPEEEPEEEYEEEVFEEEEAPAEEEMMMAPLALGASEEEAEEAEAEEAEEEEEEELALFALLASDNYEMLDGEKVYNFEDDIDNIILTINGQTVDLGAGETYDELIGENVSFSVRIEYELEGNTLGPETDDEGNILNNVDTIIYRAPEGLILKNGEQGDVYDGGTAVGTYTIENGLVKITFYDNFVNNNATGNKISNGYVTWSASVSKESLTEQGSRDVNFTGTHDITFNFYQMAKSGKLSEDGTKAEWTVSLNGNHAQLDGYTLADRVYHYYGSNPKTAVDASSSYSFDSVQMKNVTTGAVSTISLPYTFGATTDVYELTYTTDIDASLELDKIRNEIILMKDNQTFRERAEVTPLTPSSLKKKHVKASDTYSEDGNTINVGWLITLYTGGYGISASQASEALTDTLTSNNTFYTKALLQETKAAVDQALAEAGLSDISYEFYTTDKYNSNKKLTLDQMEDDQKYYNFSILFKDDLPADKTLNIPYYSQLDITGKIEPSIWVQNKVGWGPDSGERIGDNVATKRGNYYFHKKDKTTGSVSNNYTMSFS